MSMAAFEAYIVELKCRHDEGKIDDAQYWAGLLAISAGYAERNCIEKAVQHLGLIPEEFLLAIPTAGRPQLTATVLKLAQIFRTEGIISSALESAGRPS